MRPYRWIVLVTAFCGVLGTIGFGRFGYSAILPSMQQDLGITNAAAGTLASWNLGGYMLMAAVGGFLAARLGARKVASTGIVITATGMLLTGLSNGLVAASAARLLTGLGSGMVLVPSITLMAAWFHSRRLGLASSIVSSGAALALILAGLAVPPIISGGGDDGWRLAWFFFGGTAVCIGILYAAVQRDRPDNPAAGRSGPGAEVRMSGSLGAMARRTGLDFKQIVRSRYTWRLGFIYLLYGFAFLIYMTFFQKRLTSDLGYSSAAAGYIFLLVGLGGFFGGALSGSVSDRIGRGRAIALMCLVMGAAAALFGWWPARPGLILSAFILGLAGMGFPGVVGAGCGDQYGPVLASAGLGLVTLFTGVGMVFGPYVAGKLADITGSLTWSYTLACGVFVLAAAVSLRLPQGEWAARDRGARV